jgi:uncharacterized protein
MILLNRRSFFSTLKYAAAAATGVGVYTRFVEPHWVEFTEVTMPIKGLPAAWEGRKVVQLSDIHVGSQVDSDFLIKSFRRTQALDPDVVVYTGDFVSYQNADQFDQMKAVYDHAPHGRLGTLGVLGNHDYGHQWREAAVASEIVQLLGRRGIHLLRNEARTLEGLDVIGVDDRWSINYYPHLAQHHAKAGHPQIVLCHNPDGVDHPGWAGYDGWFLSGHTHGGQCKPPFLPAPLLPVQNKRYSHGQVALATGGHLYVNRALGHLTKVRINVRPEITVFTLTAAG